MNLNQIDNHKKHVRSFSHLDIDAGLLTVILPIVWRSQNIQTKPVFTINKQKGETAAAPNKEGSSTGKKELKISLLIHFSYFIL